MIHKSTCFSLPNDTQIAKTATVLTAAVKLTVAVPTAAVQPTVAVPPAAVHPTVAVPTAAVQPTVAVQTAAVQPTVAVPTAAVQPTVAILTADVHPTVAVPTAAVKPTVAIPTAAVQPNSRGLNRGCLRLNPRSTLVDRTTPPSRPTTLPPTPNENRYEFIGLPGSPESENRRSNRPEIPSKLWYTPIVCEME